MFIREGARIFALSIFLNIYCAIICCSCSTVESNFGAALSQLTNSITGGEETKQAKPAFDPEKPAISAAYFNQLLRQVKPGEVRQELVKIFINDHKISDISDLGSLVAFGFGTDGILYLIGNQGQMAPFLDTGTKNPLSVGLSLRSQLLAVSSLEGLKLYDLTSGEVRYELTKLRTRINSLDFDQPGETLLIGGTDARVYRWKFAYKQDSFKQKEQALERYVGHPGIVSQVRYHPKGRVFFSADWTGRVVASVRYDADAFEGEYIKNATTGRPFTAEALRVGAEYQADGVVEKLECNANGELLAVASDAGQVALLLVRGFRGLAKIQAHRGLIYDLAFSDDGLEIVTVGRDDHLRVWSIESFALQSADPTEAKITLAREMLLPNANRVALTEDGRVVVGFKTGELKIMKVKDIPLPLLEKDEAI